MPPREPRGDLVLLFTTAVLLACAAALLASKADAQTPINQPLPVPSASHPADLTVTAHTADGETLVIPGIYLHGVAWFDRKHDGPFLDLGRGVIRPIRPLLEAHRQKIAGFKAETWSVEIHPTGRDLSDLCDPTAWTDSPEGFSPALNWCLMRADTLILPPGTFPAAGPVRIPDGTHIQGAGGTIRLGLHTDRYGYSFTPVAEAETQTRFRIPDARAFTPLAPILGDSLTDHERMLLALGQAETAWFAASGAQRLSITDLALDGNGEGDLTRFLRARTSPSSDVQRSLHFGYQNAPSHTGIAVNPHGGLVVDTAHVSLTRVALTGWAATGALGHRNTRWTLTDLYGSNTLYNHILYNTEGTWDHVTLEGYSWHHTVQNGGSDIRGLVVRRVTANPARRETGASLDIRLDYRRPVHIRDLYADLAAWSDASGSGPGLTGAGRLADLDPEASLTMGRVTVITNGRPEGQQIFFMRQPGAVSIDTLHAVVDNPERFELAYGRTAVGQVTVSTLSVRDLTDATQAPVIHDPIPTPEVDETRQLEETVRSLEAQIQALRQQIEDAEGREQNLIDALGAMEGERDAAVRALEEIKAALRALAGSDPAQE